MARTPKIVEEEGTLLKITFVCELTGARVTIPGEKVYIEAAEHKCGLCGSHGYIKTEFDCPVCEKKHEVEIRSW